MHPNPTVFEVGPFSADPLDTQVRPAHTAPSPLAAALASTAGDLWWSGPASYVVAGTMTDDGYRVRHTVAAVVDGELHVVSQETSAPARIDYRLDDYDEFMVELAEVVVDHRAARPGPLSCNRFPLDSVFPLEGLVAACGHDELATVDLDPTVLG